MRLQLFLWGVTFLLWWDSGSAAGTASDGNHPLFKWAQDRARIFITIHVAAVQDEKVEFQERKLVWEGLAGRTDAYSQEGQRYTLDLEFFKPINASECVSSKLDKQYKLTIVKGEEGPHWPHLLSTSKKLEEGNMRIDWTRWDLESDDVEESDDETRADKGKKRKKRKRKKGDKKAKKKEEL